jgi:hypothetical protein
MNMPEQKLPVAMLEKPFVIWGFRDMSHTHGYIHANFYRVLKRNHATVHWLDDTPQNLSKIPNGSIVLTVNIACNYLIPTPKNMYIAHNCHDSETFKEFRKNHPDRMIDWTFTQSGSVGTRASDGSIALFNIDTRVLSQPYGTPFSTREFKPFSDRDIRSQSIENHIGSVWNDEMGRGNAEDIEELSAVLHPYGIKLRRVELGKLARTQIGQMLEKRLIKESAIGISVHSKFQVSNGYLACRLFKSVSLGRVPVTNQTSFRSIFGENMVGDVDINNIVAHFMSLGTEERRTMSRLSQSQLANYTYEAGLRRMEMALKGQWA